VPAFTRNFRVWAADTSSMSRLLQPLTYRARSLRRAETPAERELWRWLRGRQLDGAKFRRQQPLGPFVVDFFCVDAGLVVEVDGASHFPPPQRDRIRDLWLTAAGLVVLRFENCQILETLDDVLERIRRAIHESRFYKGAEQPAPLSLRERGRG